MKWGSKLRLYRNVYFFKSDNSLPYKDIAIYSKNARLNLNQVNNKLK